MKLEVTANARIDGAAMRNRRILAGLSVKALATAVGVSRPYISILETHPGRTCSPPVFRRICDALGVADRSELLRDAGIEPGRDAA